GEGDGGLHAEGGREVGVVIGSDGDGGSGVDEDAGWGRRGVVLKAGDGEQGGEDAGLAEAEGVVFGGVFEVIDGGCLKTEGEIDGDGGAAVVGVEFAGEAEGASGLKEGFVEGEE